MTTREQIRGQWNQLRGRIEERWSQLSPHDLDNVNGDSEQLVGTIQQKTGQARQKIEAELDSLIQDVSASSSDETSGGSAGKYVSQAQESMGEYGRQAQEKMGEYGRQAQEQALHYAESARHQYEQMNEMFRERYRQAEDTVRSRPAESVAIAFGTGLLTGLVVGLICKR